MLTLPRYSPLLAVHMVNVHGWGLCNRGTLLGKHGPYISTQQLCSVAATLVECVESISKISCLNTENMKMPKKCFRPVVPVNSLPKDLLEMKSTKVFSVFHFIKLLSWSLLFIWFLPPHETVKTQ